jgi:type IV pilus assembly protein PilC
MPQFAWEGRTRAGEVRRGVMEAATEPDVNARLRRDNIAVTRVKKKAREINLDLKFGTGVKPRDIVVFTRQLATMIDAGQPIVQCLDILAQQTENKHFGKVLQGVKTDVESGAHLSEALAKQPKVFTELFTNLVSAGEQGGILDRILQRLATYLEKAEKLKGQIKGAMIYPIGVLVVAVAVVILLMWKVIPVFENMFKDFGGGSLPAPTQFVINISHGFVNNWYIVIGVLVAIIVGVPAMLRTKRGTRIFDQTMLKVPIFGPLLRKVAVARFTRTLGTLLGSGVPILDSMEIVAKTAGNVIVAEAIMYARLKISEGKNITDPLGETRVFPSMVVQMIGVGEQTGRMDTMLQKIADFYEEEVDVAVGALTKLMEPIMMVFLGAIVGGLLVAMYMPIFEMAGNIKAT